MKRVSSFIVSTVLTGCVFAVHTTTVKACSAAPLPPDQLSIKAEVIVRATAVSYNKAPEGNFMTTGVPDSAVEFRVEEVLKGEEVPNTIAIAGYLTDKDDFNDRPIPYDFISPRGRRGSCFANSYKEGAEFLLFLKKREDGLTPYWAALTPTNEQLQSVNDPWLVWVRDHLQKKKEGREVGQFIHLSWSASRWLFCVLTDAT